MAIEIINSVPAEQPQQAAQQEAPAATSAQEALPASQAPAITLETLAAELATLKASQAAKPSEAATSQAAQKEADLLTLLLENPEEAIGRVLSKREASAMEQRRKAAEANAAVLKDHPDLPQIDAAGEFVKWVREGTPVVKALYRQSEEQMDGALRSHLLSLWKGSKSETSEEDKVAAKAAEAKATAQAGGPVKGGQSAPTAPTFKRREIQEMQERDPDRYLRMLPEIKQAYLDGRVK